MESTNPNIFLEAQKSNDPPSAHELQLVEIMHRFSTNRIGELEQDNAKIAVEMLSAQAQHDALKVKLESLKDRKTKNVAAMRGHVSNIKAYGIVRAPVRRVPLDLLQEIARHALPDHPSLANNQAPVSLSHVSRSWRGVLLSMPRMWTTLYIPLVPTEHRRYLRSAMGINSFFKRSKTLPLSLTIAFDDEPKSTFVYRFFKNIEDIFPRVQTLVISARSAFTPLQSLRDSYDWEYLQSLTFISKNGGPHPFTSTEEEHHVDKVFQYAPRLREVIIDQAFATYNAAVNLLPWDQIQALSLSECLDSDVWISLMKRCPNLTFGRFVMADSSLPGSTIYHHQHLEELFITFYDRPDTDTHLFDQIYFPNLRTLRMGQIEYDEIPAPTPASYLQFRTLHTLSLLGYWNYPIMDLTALLHETNALTSLELDIETDFEALFEALTPVRGSTQYLPNLKNMVVDIYTGNQIQNAILAMARGRCDRIPGYARLETLVLAFSGNQQLCESVVVVLTAHQSELKDLSWEVVNKHYFSDNWYNSFTPGHNSWKYRRMDEEDP